MKYNSQLLSGLFMGTLLFAFLIRLSTVVAQGDPSSRACKTDSDCAIALTSCSHCTDACTGINKTEKFKTLDCQGYSGVSCHYDCLQDIPLCENKTCIILNEFEPRLPKDICKRIKPQPNSFFARRCLDSASKIQDCGALRVAQNELSMYTETEQKILGCIDTALEKCSAANFRLFRDNDIYNYTIQKKEGPACLVSLQSRTPVTPRRMPLKLITETFVRKKNMKNSFSAFIYLFFTRN
jgi:hypothetical protein